LQFFYLPPEHKLIEPAYASFRAADIPVITHAGGQVRLICGRLEDTEGPMRATSPTFFAHVHLEPGENITLPVDDMAELGLYVLDGNLQQENGSPLGPGALAILTPGTHISLTAVKSHGAEVALLGGAPVQGAILFGGPFVMDTPERTCNTGIHRCFFRGDEKRQSRPGVR